MISDTERQELLDRAKNFFTQVICPNHLANTRKLAVPKEFNIHPFLVKYLAAFLTGTTSAEAIARALIYPRVLGTSITTSFGQNTQGFISEVFSSSFASAISGIDIEFTDAVDGRRKYCQIKSGPTTLNKDDVKTIHEHFTTLRRTAQTNRLAVQLDDLVVGVLYGEVSTVSPFYKRLRDNHGYTLLVGETFWYHLTGIDSFYYDLIDTFASAAQEQDCSELLEETVKKLAQTPEIQQLARRIIN